METATSTIAPSKLTAPDRSAWRAAMAAHERAITEDAAFDPQYWEVHRAWEAGKPSIDMIHWKEFPFAQRDHTARVMDIEREWSHFLAGQGKWWGAPDPDARKAQFRAALDSVQAFRDAAARHDRESGMNEVEERWNALGDEVARTRDVLMAMPAPDLSALRWKLNQLRDGDGDLVGWSADYVRQTFVDIDRLIPAEEV
jgi:hypothetical protein